MKNFLFTSKAKTLFSLYNKLQNAIIPDIKIYNFCDIDTITHQIQQDFKDSIVVIRSSSNLEDLTQQSNAGKFKSVLNVNSQNSDDIKKAVLEVISSYPSNDNIKEFFVQKQVQNIKISGVAFSADIDNLAPYYVINYDISSNSDTITSGTSSNHKLYIHYNKCEQKPKYHFIKKIIDLLNELIDITQNQFIDIEFAFDQQENIYLLQVRPIVTSNKLNLNNLDYSDCLFKVYKKIEKLQAPHPNLLGEKAIYGVMPDWNPAEMIGFKPKSLALSLYKEFITDNIWAYQRDNYGYRNLRSHPLLVSFIGIPYIDIRVDFNSFIPKSLNETIAAKLVEYYLNKLLKYPHLHDKVEFDIIFSCYYFGIEKKLKELLNYNFNENEIKRIEFALLELTNNIINPYNSLLHNDLEKIEILKQKFDNLINSNLSTIDKIYWLTEDCKRFGTLPFAGIARSAFIAVQFLKSLIAENIITIDDYNNFLSSLNTITNINNNKIADYFNGKISKEELLKEIGHLRPGTYDITSLSYDENFDSYYLNYKFTNSTTKNENFTFSNSQIKQIKQLLIENGLNIDYDNFINFIKTAIEGREYSKFVFTKSISYILKLIENFGSRFGFSRDDLAFLDFSVILKMYSNLDARSVDEIFAQNIEMNKKLYNYTLGIKLPHIILSPDDICSFEITADEPNFITNKRCIAPVVNLENAPNEDLTNKIVFIKSADPGFDYLFSKNIAGLVTQFGGANSHMAIRCSELQIPAVIGAGLLRYSEWSKANILEIDCNNKLVTILS